MPTDFPSQGASRSPSPLRHSPFASRRGLTLAELLTVIAIISILISILIPTVTTVRNSARKAKAKIILTHWATAIETFRGEYGFYPAFDFANADDNLVATTEDADEFVRALSAREVDGSKIDASDLASGNKKRISFYTFSEGEIDEGNLVVDSFGGHPIAILFDKNLDGIIKVGGMADKDYDGFPDIGFGETAPPKWPTGGLRSGVAIYSPGPGGSEGDIITTW